MLVEGLRLGDRGQRRHRKTPSAGCVLGVCGGKIGVVQGVAVEEQEVVEAARGDADRNRPHEVAIEEK
jgi:hypothetical protein